jgi:LysM domain
MPHRSPARYLAPLALIGFAVALFLVVTSSRTNDEQPATPTTTIERTAEDSPTRELGERSERRRRARTYTVEAGDTPSGIAEKTGVSLIRIEELNPDLDPQSLNVGDKIRIR